MIENHRKNLIPSFARRLLRPLKQGQKDLLSDFLPKFELTPDSDFARIFQPYNKIAVEIGFGDGEHLLTQAKNNPDTLHIGCEPYINGVVKVLNAIAKNNIDNIRLYTDDARILLKSLPDKILDTVYIICPDPWPKKRHFKRRLITEQFLKQISPKVITGGYVLMVTDHLDYAHWIHEAILQSELFPDISKNIEVYTDIPDDWIYTKYQKTGITQGSDIYFFKCYIR